MKTVDIIIPAYNEAHRITPTLQAYAEFFKKDAQLTVVMNGCTDTTHQVVEKIQQTYPETIRYINITDSIGKGAAILEGWKTSQAEVVSFIDADGSTSPQEFQKLLLALPTHDGVIASRFLKDSKIINRQGLLRTIMSRVFIQFVKIFFRLPYTDTQCGAKVFRRNVVLPLFDTITSTDMAFDVELLWRLYRNNNNIIEIPTVWVDKPQSAMLGKTHSFLSTGWQMVWKLYKLRFSEKYR